MPPPPSLLALARAPHLVEIHGDDQDGADSDLLPERLDTDDDEAVLEHGGDEDAEDGPEDRPDAAEETGAADDHGGDRVEVVGAVPSDRGGAEAGEVHEAGEAGQEAGERV